MAGPHGRNLRIGRYDEIDRIYLLTAVTLSRWTVFHNLTAARCCVGAMRYQDQVGRTTTHASVLMPDHLHWLITLEAGTLAEVMRSMKSYSARMINRCPGMSGALWQHGYHDDALRRDEDVRSVARYVIFNPVRVGLVTTVWDYSHWDAVWVT